MPEGGANESAHVKAPMTTRRDDVLTDRLAVCSISAIQQTVEHLESELDMKLMKALALNPEVCKSCIPSAGAKMEQKHTTHKHNKMCPHYHVFTVMQSPPINGCICFAPKQETYPTSQGYMSYVRPTGGGIEIIK